MKLQIARPILLNYAISPYGLALFSTALFLFAWLFPSGAYSSLINEPNYMHLDPETLLFFLLCIVGFWSGLLLFDFLFPAQPLLESKQASSHLSGFFLLLPLVITTMLTALEAFLILKSSPNILILLAMQEGDAVKSGAQDLQVGPLGIVEFLHIGVLWWTYWKFSNSVQTPGCKVLSRLVLSMGLIVKIAISIFKVSRADLMPVLGGFAILYLLGKVCRKEFTTRSLLRSICLLPLAGTSLFLVFGLLRGADDMSRSYGDFAGYTIASYNRLASLLHGTMRYPYGGRGVYLSNFLAYDNRVNFILPLKHMLGWPDFLDQWNSEFQAPQLAGLNPSLIWSGAFGYLFSDFGWATPGVLLIYGVLYGFVWKQMKSGTTMGVTIYPWFAFSVLSWFTANVVFDTRLFLLIFAGLLLVGYEKLLSVRQFSFVHS